MLPMIKQNEIKRTYRHSKPHITSKDTANTTTNNQNFYNRGKLQMWHVVNLFRKHDEVSKENQFGRGQ